MQGTHQQDPYAQTGLQHPTTMPTGKTGVAPGGEGLNKQQGYAGGVNEGPSQWTGSAQPQQQQTTTQSHFQHQQQPIQREGGVLGQHHHAEPLAADTGVRQAAPVTGYVADPQSASSKLPKQVAKDQESDAHRLAQEAAVQSKQQNQAIMSDPGASLGTKISAAGHAIKDWADEKKHGMQADHHEKKVEQKQKKAVEKGIHQKPVVAGHTESATYTPATQTTTQTTTTAPTYPKQAQFEAENQAYPKRI